MYAKVIVDISHSNVDRFFEYEIPPHMQVLKGQRVKAPFGSKLIDGIVLDISKNCEFEADKIKPLKEALDGFTAVDENQISLAFEIKNKYQTTLSSALRLMFPAVLRHDKGKFKTESYVFLNTQKLDEMMSYVTTKNGSIKYKKQFEIIVSLEKNNYQKASAFNRASLDTLIKKGYVISEKKQVERNPFGKSCEKKENPVLTDDQNAVLEKYYGSKNGKFLLKGVTGSGKTEIYIRIIQNALKEGKGAIILVPEISLTPQIYRNIRSRIDEDIAVFHSGLSDGERFDEWYKVKSGKCKVVLGARSAVFAPVANLGVIIIDEEHENSYKSDNYPKYTAHEIAAMRCKNEGIRLLLGSATPSVDTFFRCKNGEYELLELKNRMFGLNLPKVEIVDMGQELRNGNKSTISARLKSELEITLKQKKQAMLFLNRRGYNTFVMCRGCGYSVKCDACDVTMTYHKSQNILKCHYCGRVKPVTKICPVCGKPYLKYFGIGTQKIEEQIKEMFPYANVLRMDLDTMGKKDAHIKIFNDFEQGKADILIGTQMISKGFDFKNVRLSAIIAADTMLNIPDYKSVERTFVHITQVAGRAGREKEGIAILQTYSPDNYAIQFASKHDYEGFYKQEIFLRNLGNLPPCTNMVQFRFSGKKEESVILAVKDFLRKIRKAADNYMNDIISVRAGEANVKRINEMARYDIYLNLKKHEKNDTIIEILQNLFSQTKYDGVMVGIDIE